MAAGRMRRGGANLYDRWLNALNVQWAASPPLPSNRSDWKAWDAKRLQTGLASWATLRHATVLVNETSGAECGEGGYEEIVLRAPRGYVEPDPATFTALAGLFDAAAVKLRGMALEGERIPGKDSAGTRTLRQGLLNRLKESAQHRPALRLHGGQELRGQALTDSEYEVILDVGKVAEHHFLVYKSLSTQGLGLANPEPIPKIADVAHGPEGKPYLYAAVGRPMEWNQIVPFFGRREIVKGRGLFLLRIHFRHLVQRQGVAGQAFPPNPSRLDPFPGYRQRTFVPAAKAFLTIPDHARYRPSRIGLAASPAFFRLCLLLGLPASSPGDGGPRLVFVGRHPALPQRGQGA